MKRECTVYTDIEGTDHIYPRRKQASAPVKLFELKVSIHPIGANGEPIKLQPYYNTTAHATAEQIEKLTGLVVTLSDTPTAPDFAEIFAQVFGLAKPELKVK